MTPTWFKPRGYTHFDVPVGPGFISKVVNPDFVSRHSWTPLIHYVKRIKRYKPQQGRTVYKERSIMYASHRDACIMSKYSYELSRYLDQYYIEHQLTDHVIAYRSLGKSNYDFSADAYKFCLTNSPCVVLCFDVTGFFDNLNHKILKQRLKLILGYADLPDDWYKVFRSVTQFQRVERAALQQHSIFGARLRSNNRTPVATIRQVKAAGISISANVSNVPGEPPRGIPQGTPISSTFSNVYMIEVDREMSALCHEHGALYQRYSDDILIACPTGTQAEIEKVFLRIIADHKLEVKDEKTDRIKFDPAYSKAFQYLGFNMSPDGVTIRPGSLARQWRKSKRSIARAKRVGLAAIASGRASKIYTRSLRKKLQPIGIRNFPLYSRHAAKAFTSRKIMRQVLRFERMSDAAIRRLNAKLVPDKKAKLIARPFSPSPLKKVRTQGQRDYKLLKMPLHQE